MADDQQLWQQLKRGDRTAFDEIYRTYSDALYKYGYKFSNNARLIEDCMHDLFIYIWKSREGLANTTAIKPYLLTAYRNRIIKEIKKGRKTKLEKKEALEIHFDCELSKEQAIVQEEGILANKKMLYQAFNQLSPHEKEAVYLKYYNHMPTDEICKIMKISNQSFRSVLSSSIKKLKHKILN